MRAKFTYLNISVGMRDSAGQFVVYGDTADGKSDLLPDITMLHDHFDSLTDGYMIWHAGGRRAFSYFMTSPDSRVLQMAVTISMAPEVLMPGRQVVTLLGSIKSRIYEGETLTEPLIERLASEAGFPEEALVSPDNSQAAPAGAPMCYRTYSSPAELANIFGFPRQKDYAGFTGVIIVPASVLAVPGSELPQVTAPVDKALMVVCPPEVTASAMRVEFTDHLTVVYNCQGFDPVSVMFEVGTTNRYVRINGPALVVNSARHAGIVFHKRIPYTVSSGGGVAIDTYTVLINGRTANRNDEGFEVSNSDFVNGKAKVSVSSTNFSSYSREFTPEQLSEAAPLVIVLEPESKDVMLRLDFGDGRVVEEALNIEKNTPEYCQLRAGRFHGFRAHRLMGSSPETYNVDVRPAYDQMSSGQTPDTPAENAASVVAESAVLPGLGDTHAPSGPVAPVMEKASTAMWEEKKSERKAPEFVNESNIGKPSKGGGRKINIDKILMVSVTIVILVLAIWYLASRLGKAEDSDGQSASDSTELVALQGAVAQGAAGMPVQAVAMSADEQADVDYLNTNSKWRRDNLKTDTYRALYDAMTEGDIEAVVANDYFKVKGRATNSRADRVINLLWTAKGSNQEKNHRKILKALKSKDGIDLYDLVEALARKMPPKSEENTGVRPQI